MIELTRYFLETLRKDEEFILYRGQNKDDAAQVLVLSPVLQSPALESLRRLEHELSLREDLDPAWSVRPREIARHWDRTVLVLEDPGGVPLDQLLGPARIGCASGPAGRASALADAGEQALGRPHALAPHGERSHSLAPNGDVAFFLRLAVSLSMAIDHLHHRGIIHKDIKPANVLANSVTGQCWLMGFGIASRLPRERQAPEAPEFVAGTLAYMAPEQTGRMNRSIDSRSDLYSFGVTLYEMLTGTLPFTASDPMEWVHCHIARQPIPPAERAKNVPAIVSAIIMKLLAKTAEDRYQTAAGAESDLRRCLTEWERGSAGEARLSDPTELVEVSPKSSPYQIQEFALGEHDNPDRLLIPEKLYGRAREIGALLASFERVVASGTPELVFVSGFSGIGKSSVVNELHKVLVPPRGLFASGKFDQFKRDIPYATLAQAFESLIIALLGKKETELRRWRDALLDALGPNGQLIVDLVPKLKLIIGEQPPVPNLPPQDAQRRFQLVFRRFIGVFARPEHPLALFLDDLQWLDAATLDLLEDLLTSDFTDQQSPTLQGLRRGQAIDFESQGVVGRAVDCEGTSQPKNAELHRTARPDVRYLLLIGAYRDNEVNSAHPLMRKLATIRQGGGAVREIILAPLAREDLGQLIADSLHCEPERASPLASLVHEKTGGNPFFAIQFISALAEEGLLTFDYDAAGWSWDLGRIRAKGHTDNVVDLMVAKLHRLPGDTQNAVRQLACLGISAQFSVLAIISESSEEEIHRKLWEAVRAGLVLRSENSYRFLHDRVQEAAYSLIPEESRAEAHLRIGRLLAAHTSPEKREQRIFEIVNQLNRGSRLITSTEEREQVAKLNLIAGRRAKISTAYVSALSYLATGRALLSEQAWEDRYELVFSIECLMAECELLAADTMAAEKRLSMLVRRTKSEHEVAIVTRLRLTLYTTLDQSDRAVEVCLEYLRRSGTDWSPHPTSDEVQREFDRIWSQVGSRQIEELIDLPLMTNPDDLDALDVLAEVVTPALFCDENLSSLVICRMVNLSLEHGNSDGSCFAYVWFAIITGPRFGNYDAGFRFGRLGYDLVEERGLKRFQARTYMSFGDIVLPWTKHVRAGRELVRRAFDAANEIGDVTFAGYCCDHLTKNMLAAGDQLVEVQREAENGLQFAQKVRFGLVVDHIKAQLGLIRTLRGLTPKFGSFNDDQFDELRFERYLASNPALAELECWYWVRKLQARYLAGDYASAVDASLSAQRQLWTSPSQFETAELCFYGALSHAASWDPASPDQRQQHFEALVAHHHQLEVWAENCPENFENRAALVGAEIARIEHRELDAERLYEQAIRSSQANGFVQNEALANEVAARFYAARGFDTIAYAYLGKARYCYLRWEATGKVRQLDELYPQLREQEALPRATSTIGAPVDRLDLATVIKVSQAVSGEIVLEKLIDTLMRTAIEHAGAERGLLILQRGVELRIEAEATTSGDSLIVRSREASLGEAMMPEAIVNYVVRTQENLILDDASAQSPFSADMYIRRHHARSILCLPLINQGNLIGLLYLENNLTPNVFTPARIAVLKLLASQAAISLENTRLYSDLEEREAKIRRLVDANIMGIYIWNLQGEILDANEAFLHILGYSREDLLSGGMRWGDLTPPEWRDRDEQADTELKLTGTIQPFEKEYFRKDGSRVPVLLGCATFKGGGNEGVAFVLDLSEQKRSEDERKRAEEALQKAQAELAHVTRVAALGELTASIAHEINQPLAAVVNNASACLRWLAAQNLEEARHSASLVIADGHRAGEIIGRIRALAKKAPPQKEWLDLNETIGEVIVMVRGEVGRNRISLQTQLANDLPPISGDKIQLQQVILNLLINSIEALSGVDEGPRDLSVSTEKFTEIPARKPRAAQIGESEEDVLTDKALVEAEGTQVLIAVRDSGPGLDPQRLDHLFDAFYTTKPQGLGMGLAISRSIIEAHGGRLWAKANAPRGAVFQFTLPISEETVSQ
ncbi:MAG TPA: AAA family ATPase [Chthoniobacterales bacterium]|nr:AAA family ATPase [Chthoniobacterales bacterium]